jgi:hypothetical protein
MNDLSSITSRIERVTPEIAKRLLERVVSSGKLDQASVQAFEGDMRDGRWTPNGAPIVLSPDGQVLDGRTRLNACIRSGAPFDTLIVQGVDIAAFETIDSVRKRTLADILSMRKENYGRAFGAALKILWTTVQEVHRVPERHLLQPRFWAYWRSTRESVTVSGRRCAPCHFCRMAAVSRFTT